MAITAMIMIMMITGLLQVLHHHHHRHHHNHDNDDNGNCRCLASCRCKFCPESSNSGLGQSGRDEVREDNIYSDEDDSKFFSVFT